MQDSGYVNMDIQVPALAFEYKDKPGVYIGEYEDCLLYTSPSPRDS